MVKKNILIISSGGREHAIAWKLKQSKQVGTIYFAPGNGGTAHIGTNTGINALDFEKLIEFAKQNAIDLTVAGPDDILAAGIVNEFNKHNLPIFGPTKEAAQIESSKAFAKKLMQEEHIPTAQYQTFTNITKAKAYVKKHGAPIVIKASGLALGKGVVVAQTMQEALVALEDAMVKKVYGDAGNEVVIEEYLQGKEVSIHAFSDGENVALFPTSRDHKPIFDGNKGPNTGGMGTIAPLTEITPSQLEEIKKTIVLPLIKGMKKRNIPFAGCLYPGLMMTKDGPKVVEFNSRFGDPETESYMRLLETDLFDILDACVKKTLHTIKIEWAKKFACCIILASKGYPASSEKGVPIYGLAKLAKQKDIEVFHLATKKIGKSLVTNGGRVLGITATGKTLEEALKKAYSAIGTSGIHFKNMQYRKDIGRVNKQITSVIFDMDGIIADTESIESQSLEILLKNYGKTPKKFNNGLVHVVGLAGNAVWADFKKKYKLTDDVNVLRVKKREIFEKLIKKELKPYDGFIILLKALKKNGYKIALASNRNRNHIELIIEELGVKKYFDVVVGPSDTRKHKPHPDIYLEAAKQLNSDPENCVALEDTEYGIQSAFSAGMKVIAIPNKYTNTHDFSTANKVVQSLKDITLQTIKAL